MALSQKVATQILKPKKNNPDTQKVKTVQKMITKQASQRTTSEVPSWND